MVTNELERWGLHELEGSGYFANDAGSSHVNPVYEVKNNVESRSSNSKPVKEVAQPRDLRRAEIRSSDIKPVIEAAQLRVVEIRSSDIIPVNDVGEPLVQQLRVPFQYSEPPLPSPPNTVNDAVIAQALHEEFQKLAAAEAAGQACAKEKVW